jgi:hypothetical protein
MNFRNKMLISLRNNIHKNIHEHLKCKLFTSIEFGSNSIIVSLVDTAMVDTAMVRSTMTSLITDKCWGYEF